MDDWVQEYLEAPWGWSNQAICELLAAHKGVKEAASEAGGEGTRGAGGCSRLLIRSM